MAQPWERNWGTAPQGGVSVTPIPASPSQQAEEERKRQQQAFEAQRIAMEKERLRMQQDAAAREAAKPVALPTGAAAATQKTANLNALVTQINRVQELFNSGQRDNAVPILGSLMEYLPTQANTQFDAAASGLAEQGFAAFRVPGAGSQSDQEQRQFAEANKPSTWSNDSANLERLRQLRNRVDETRAALGLPPAEWVGVGGQQDNAPPGTPAGIGGMASSGGPPAPGSYGSANPTPPVFSPGGPQYEAAQGTRTENDPRMAAVGAEYRQRLASGQSSAEILQWLSGQGVGPQTVMQAVEQLKYREQHPEVPADRYSITTNREVPLSAYEQTATDFGSGGAGAYAMGAGQFLSGNTLDNMASDPSRARQVMDISRAQNPGATMAGEISGGVMAAMSGEAALSRLGMAPGFLRGLLADSSMGAANGAGMADDGNRIAGAAQGALAAGVGSALGTGAMKAAGRALTPSGGELRPLYDAGVRPTPGQRFANSGTAGRILNTTEEALQSVPIVGQAIRGAREKARDQFQVGAFNQALQEIGEELPKGMKPGTDPHAYAQQAFKRVYEQARSSMRLVADEELSSELGQLAPDIATLGPKAQQKLKAIMANNVNNRLVGGELSGAAYKKSIADLGRQTARLRNSPMAEDQALADVLDGVRGALDSAARRHSDPAAVELLDAADAGYARLVRIEDAAARRGGGAGVFSPSNFDSSVQRAAGGVRSKAYSRGDALMQDYAKAGRSLDDTLPNSGTADRAMVGWGATGALGTGTAMGAVPPQALAALGAIATAYAPGVRRVTTGAMAPAGPTRSAIARQLEKRARLLGRAGAATGVASWPGKAPGQ